MIAEGELTRQIGVKLLLPRYSQLYTTNWAITLEALDAQVTAVGLGDIFDEITQTEADILADIDQLRNDLL